MLLRRNLFGTCAALLSLGAAAAKKTKKRVAYQDRPKDIRMCATCSFFQAPKSRAVVEGNVSPDGWCNLYAAVD